MFSVISSAPSGWSVLFLLVVFLPRIFLLSFPFFGVLPLSPCPPAVFETLPGRSSFCSLWRLLAGFGSFRLSRHRCLPRVVTYSCLSCLNFVRRLRLPFVFSLSLFRCGLFGILWALSLTSSFCVLLGPFCYTSLVLFLFLPVLVLSLSLRALSSRSLSKNALSFFTCEVITEAYSSAGRSLPSAPSSSSSVSSSSRPRSSLRVHGVRGVAASWAFHRNAPLASILESATWSSPFIFSSFYLSDVQFSSSSGYGLGPLVVAGCVV